MKALVYPLLVTSLTCLASECDNLLVNGSFENSPLRPSIWETFTGNDTTSLPGWRMISEGVEWSSHTAPSGGPKVIAVDGDYIIDLNNYDSKAGGGIEQTFPTRIGDKYLVSFFTGTMKAYQRKGTAKLNVSIGDEEYIYNLKTDKGDSMDWTYISFSFIANQTQTTLRFTTDTNSFEHFTAIDNVSVIPLNKPRAILVQ